MHTFPLSRSAGKAWAQAAGLALALFAGAAMAQDAPPAADVALTAQEFQAFVAKPFRSQTPSGKVYHLDLQPGGKAVISNDYNDVGVWRSDGDNGYCTRWNKQRADEKCYRVVKRAGRHAAVAADGTFAAWVGPLE